MTEVRGLQCMQAMHVLHPEMLLGMSKPVQMSPKAATRITTHEMTFSSQIRWRVASLLSSRDVLDECHHPLAVAPHASRGDHALKACFQHVPVLFDLESLTAALKILFLELCADVGMHMLDALHEIAAVARWSYDATQADVTLEQVETREVVEVGVVENKNGMV